MHDPELSPFSSAYTTYTSGFEINARPLARGDWKPWGMSRIFAQVIRRASGYFNLFCQLYVTLNETNYWNLTRKSIKIITNHQNNLVLASVARTAKSCSVLGLDLYTSAHPRRISDKRQVTFLPCDFNLFDLNFLRYHEPVFSYQIWWTVSHRFGNGMVLGLSRCCGQCRVASCDA